MTRRPALPPLQLDLADAVGFDATQLNAALIRRNAAERRRRLHHNLAAITAIAIGGALALLVLLA